MENITSDTSEIDLDYGNLSVKGCSFTDTEITAASGSIETQDTIIDTLVLTDNYEMLAAGHGQCARQT